MTLMYYPYLHTPLTTLKLKMVFFSMSKFMSIDELIHIYLVIIVGHSHCGGVTASLNAARDPDFVPVDPIITIKGEPADSPLNKWLKPLTLLAYFLKLPDQSEASIATVIKANVKAQVDNLAKTETIRNAWAKKQRVFIHGWFYELSTGHLVDLGFSHGPK